MCYSAKTKTRITLKNKTKIITDEKNLADLFNSYYIIILKGTVMQT